MNKVFEIVIFAALTTPAGATEMRFYSDSQGRSAGSSTTFGDMTFYNDAQGRPVGSSTRFGDTTFFNDSMGRPTGSSQSFSGDD
jgi:YD repeat-containing protein